MLEEFYKDYKICIDYDDEPMSPRDGENLGHLELFGRNFSAYGDKKFSEPENLQNFLKENKHIAVPIYGYCHGGVTISSTPFSCPWDSGQAGIIYMTYDEIREKFSRKLVTKKLQKKILEILEQEIGELNQYMVGDIYAFTVYKGEEEVFNVGGYLDKDFCLEDAKNWIDEAE